MLKLLEKAGLLLIGICLGKTTSAQSWIEQTDNDNPFNDFSFNSNVKPSAADIDQDGDIDILSGACEESWLVFLSNNGNDQFSQIAGTQNPFEGISGCGSPEFVDFDNDGDLDLFVGDYYADKYARLTYFENDGLGNFIENLNNPFISTNFDYSANIAFTDLDDDGDLDALIGENYMLRIFENEGSNSFTEVPVNASPFSTISNLEKLSPEVIDFDADGDEDLVFGNKYGNIIAFEKVGPNNYTELNGDENPFSDFINFIQPHITFFDYENDGDADMLIGEATGQYTFFLNESNIIGLNENQLSLSAFPNPTKDILNLKSAAPIDYVNIFDANGKLLLNKAFFNSTYQIDLSSLAKGIYHVNAYADGIQSSVRIVKN